MPKQPESPRISLCMLVKDERENLARNILPLVPRFFEVVIVDTGSTDGTREALDELPSHVKVIDFAWQDSFSAARNRYLEAATGDWIYWMDADEHLEPDQVGILERCTRQGKGNAWAYKFQYGVTAVHVKLFPNLPGLSHVYRCHEQIIPSLLKAGLRILALPPEFRISNPSYSQYPERSSLRNIPLIKLDIEENPDYLGGYVRLSYEYCSLGQYEEALKVLDDLFTHKRAQLSLDKPLHRAAHVARQMTLLQQKLHRKAEAGQQPTLEEIKELIRLGGLR